MLRAHARCFRSWGLAYRELTAEELGGEAALGWELVTPQAVRGHYLLGFDAPYGAPIIRVLTPAEARTRWKHVESDGTVCLLAPGQSWMPLLRRPAIDHALRALLRIIDLNLRGVARSDPVSVRHRWVSEGARAWSLLDPEGHGTKAIAGRLHRRWIVASTREDLEAWLEHRGVQAEELVDARVVQVRDFEQVPRSLTALGADDRRVVERGGMVIFALRMAAGPLLVAVRLEPSGVLARLRVDRADRRWLHERGGNGLAAEIAQARVAIVGCGSLGGGVAELLARAGVGRLTLIDPETLSWDNVARHVLGGTAVGRPKAVELAQRLRAHLPTIPRVTALPHAWQCVAAERPRALRADLIVSTMAAWPDELALAEWSRIRGIPLVVGWLEPRAVAGHAVSLRGRCLACQFTPRGSFRRTVARWTSAAPLRLADGCHEHFLPYGYADIVPIQSLIARLALEILMGESVDATHRALVPSPRALSALGAQPSHDCVRAYALAPATLWAEHRRDWPVDPDCWHCGGAG
jgi:hypothetical protein